MSNLSAYFSENNPFNTKDKRKYDFIFDFEYSKYDINRKCRFIVGQDENFHNLKQKIASSIGKSIKIKLEELEKQNAVKQNIECIEPKLIKFYQNNEELNYSMKFGAFVAQKSKTKFEILDKTYTILINQPIIFNMELPSKIFIHFPLYPSIFDSSLVDTKNSVYFWSKSKDKLNWIQVSTDNSYTPNKNDLGSYLKLKCIPKFKSIIGEPFEAFSECVLEDFSLKCPFKKRAEFTKNKLTGRKVVSYNILSDSYVKDDKFVYCDTEALKIDYRKQLILKELTDYNADIICLQETDYKVYKNFLRDEMTKLGYKYFYDPKLGKGEGLSLFYIPSKFSYVQKKNMVIGKEIQENKNMANLWKKIKQNDIVANKLIEQNTVLQVVILQSKEKEFLLVANTHLYFHPEAAHIRLLQAGICAFYIQGIIHRMQSNCRISVIFCGDFNSHPESDVFKFFTEGGVTKHADDWKKSNIIEEELNTNGTIFLKNENEIVENINLTCNQKLTSAYGKPKFTNYTDDFKECLDYIFYDDTLILKQIVPLLDEEEMKKHTALPSIVVPSDHLALVCDFQFK